MEYTNYTSKLTIQVSVIVKSTSVSFTACDLPVRQSLLFHSDTTQATRWLDITRQQAMTTGLHVATPGIETGLMHFE